MLSFLWSSLGLSKSSGLKTSMDYKRAFAILDKDGSGSISAGELKNVLTNKGSKELSMQDLQKLIEEVDTNKDGELQMDEFKVIWKYLQEPKKENSESASNVGSEVSSKIMSLMGSFSFSKGSGLKPGMDYRKAFGMLDKDGGGSISAGELKTALTKSGSTELSAREIQQLIDEVDVNGDGELQMDEFKGVWQLLQERNAAAKAAKAPPSTQVKSLFSTVFSGKSGVDAAMDARSAFAGVLPSLDPRASGVCLACATPLSVGPAACPKLGARVDTYARSF